MQLPLGWGVTALLQPSVEAGSGVWRVPAARRGWICMSSDGLAGWEASARLCVSPKAPAAGHVSGEGIASGHLSGSCQLLASKGEGRRANTLNPHDPQPVSLAPASLEPSGWF